jgi:hypothetical protein
MNHVSLTGPEGYRSEGHEGRRKEEKGSLLLSFMQALSSWGISLF